MSLTMSLGLLVPSAPSPAQQPDNSQPAAAAPASRYTPDRIAIEGVMRRYEAAYNHQNIDELVAVWPSLQNDKKNYKKIKDEFGRADISERKVSMEVQDVQTPASGTALVRCSRTEQYMKLQTTSYSSGDLQIGSMPSQNPGPSRESDKKTVRKTTDIWLTLHQEGAAWMITAVSEKKPR